MKKPLYSISNEKFIKTYNLVLRKNEKVKNVSFRIIDEKILVDVEYEKIVIPKDGDYLVNKDNNCVFIYKENIENPDILSCYCGEYSKDQNSIYLESFSNWVKKESCRLATHIEISDFAKRLRKEYGKKWNQDKKCLININRSFKNKNNEENL